MSRVRRRELAASEPAPLDRKARLAEWARLVTEDARACESFVDAERLASSIASLWVERETDEREMIAAIAAVASAEALVVLRGLADVAGARTAGRAAEAAERLATLGIEGPEWIGDIGSAEPTRAWIVRDEPFDDSSVLFVEFCARGAGPHTLSVWVDHNLGGGATHALICSSLDDVVGLLEGTRSKVHPVAMPLDQMRAHLAQALDAKDPELSFGGIPGGPESMFPLARARLSAFPTGFELPARPEVGPDERFELLAGFLESPEGSRFRDDIDAQTVVAYAIDGCADCGDGQPLRWSPAVVGTFLCEWLPDRAGDECDVAERAPEVLGAWIAYAGRRRNVPPEQVAETIDAIDEWTAAATDAAADDRRWSPGV